MAFQVSPGVQVKEIDLSNVVPAVSSTRGAFAGIFQWGPVDEVKTVSDGQQLVDEFYKPANTDAASEDFYSAESFLKYGSSLSVVRINSTGLKSANSGNNNSILIKNADDYINSFKSGQAAGTAGSFTARCPGALGNSLSVSVCASSNAYFNDNVSLVNDASNYAVGATAITVDAGASFLKGDLIKFQNHSQLYSVTNISSNTLTIKAVNQPSAGLVSAVNNDEQIDRYWEHFGLFDKAPGTSANAAAAGASNDEIHVVVVDEDGLFTGTAGTVLESYGFVSLASDAKDSVGNSNYYKDVIESQSNYVYWTGHATTIYASNNETRSLSQAVAAAFSRPALPIANPLTQGNAGRANPTVAQKSDAWTSHFGDAELIDISFLIVGSTSTDAGGGSESAQDTLADHNSLVNNAIQLAELRKDCLVVASPRRASVVGVSSESTQATNVKGDFAAVTSSSYAVLDSGWIYQYERYNDKYCWIPGNGHTAGIMARSDLLQDPWYSPAGFSRGQYLGITKLAFNPKQASRDDLYRARINPIVTFPGQGTVLFGDKTALTSPSAFDRINVRRLFITLEKAVSTAAKAQLFEFNDSFTRAQFRASVEPFLRDVKNRRGLVDFSVVCDETNNTDSVIDRNEFVCSIFLKPAKSINYITLNFVATRSGVQFEEVYGAV
tara:strand:- start:787 stop:2787 length:2001 start_codon:yes stop_codon:yes gene_type:complete